MEHLIVMTVHYTNREIQRKRPAGGESRSAPQARRAEVAERPYAAASGLSGHIQISPTSLLTTCGAAWDCFP